MSIFRAIAAAYEKTSERKWDRVYWAVDLHGTCMKSTYIPFTYEWLSEDIKAALVKISKFKETNLILWSSVSEEEKPHILKFFADAGIKVLAFNENPLEEGTDTCHVDEKFYFSILVDDKAGFCPSEWLAIPAVVEFHRNKHGF